jgi:hypothetical protein
VPFANLVTDANVNTSIPGTYTVTYSFLDPGTGAWATGTATVTVVALQTPTISANNSTIQQGSTWDPSSNYVSGTDSLGNSVPFSNVTVTGTVNTAVPGAYQVTYSFTDPTTNKVVSQTVTVTVTPLPLPAPVLTAQNGTYLVGQNINQAITNSFVTGTDSEGKTLVVSQVTPVGFDQIPVDANGNFTTPGTYTVSYYYLDKATGQAGASNIVTITVNPAPTTPKPNLNLTTAAMYNTQSAQGVINGMLLAGTNSDGTPMTAAELQSVKITLVSGPSTTNFNVPGDYVLQFSYTDPAGNSISQTSNLYVEQDQTSLNLA